MSFEFAVAGAWGDRAPFARTIYDPRGLKRAVDSRLEELFPEDSAGATLGAAMRYAVLAPGKRIRPILTVLASWELGAPGLRALDAGCALEMVHAASLILDDLPCMDDSPVRRGAPATHVAFGQDVAVLAAIALLGRAFSAVSSAEGLSSDQRSRLAAILAHGIGAEGLSGGQLRDLRGFASAAAMAEVNHEKTGALFVAAVEMAGVIAECDEARLSAMRYFATELGQAFQILDDLMDGDPVDQGRAEDAGKLTSLSFLGRDAARRRLNLHLNQARQALPGESQLAMFMGSIFGEAELREPAFAGARPGHA